MGLKRRKVVFGPSGAWGIVALAQSHSPYLHDKSWNQEEPQALGSGAFFHLFISLPTSLLFHWRRVTKSCWQFEFSLTQSLGNRTGNCLCEGHVVSECEAGRMFYIPLTGPSFYDLPGRAFPVMLWMVPFHHCSYTQEDSGLQEKSNMDFYLSLLFRSIIWISSAAVMKGRPTLYNCHRGHLSLSHCAL